MKTVVFDLDGTLADTSADLLAAANACFITPGHGALLGPGDALTAFHGGRAMLRLGFSRLDAAWSEADVDREYPSLIAAYDDTQHRETFLYPDMVETVERLRAEGYLCAICTNKPGSGRRICCGGWGSTGCFEALVAAPIRYPVSKPDPRPIGRRSRGPGGTLARSMLVGDTETDRETARAAGVPVALVTFGPEGQGVARHAPDALLDRLEDLPALAARLIV